MELAKASALANKLMVKHGLVEKGWSFQFDNATSRLGLCRYAPKIISISRHMTGAGTVEQVEQVILHEIAHALTGPYDRYGRKVGHGQAWKVKAREIGYTGKRTSENPYVASKSVTVALVSNNSPRIGEGDPVRLSNGMVGKVIKVNRVNYLVEALNGVTYKTRINGYTQKITVEEYKAQAGGKSTVKPATQATGLVMFSKNQRIRTKSGRSKYSNLAGTIKSVGSKNYLVALDAGFDLRVPFSLAVGE